VGYFAWSVTLLPGRHPLLLPVVLFCVGAAGIAFVLRRGGCWQRVWAGR